MRALSDQQRHLPFQGEWTFLPLAPRGKSAPIPSSVCNWSFNKASGEASEVRAKAQPAPKTLLIYSSTSCLSCLGCVGTGDRNNLFSSGFTLRVEASTQQHNDA